MTTSEPAYQVETANRYTVVTLDPKLANEQWGDIHEVGNQLIERLSESKAENLLVDLSAMEYIGSSTVALVVRLWKKVKENDGNLAVISKHPVVREVLQIAGLHKVWTIVDSRDQALAELGIGRQSGGSGLLLFLGLLAAATAVAGLAIQLSPASEVDKNIVRGLLFGGAGVGLLLGLVNAIRESGKWRVVSVLAMLACLAVGIVGAIKVFG